MDDHAIETHGLTKRYGDLVAVDQLSLRVRRGEVCRVPGSQRGWQDDDPSDAVGSRAPDFGQRDGLDARPGSSESLAHIGALVEAPGFYRSCRAATTSA